MEKVSDLLAKMLTTNTGIHMLDSGGKDGRGWQRNAGKTAADFAAEPKATYEIDNDGTAFVTVSTFHYLTSILELDATCDAFNALPCDDWDGEAYGTSMSQCEWLEAQGLTIGEPWNTYNGDTILDTVLQGANVYKEGDALGHPAYILIQTHNGADVRGGYTDAKLFKISDTARDTFLNPCPEVWGEVNGEIVSTYYHAHGTHLADEDGKDVTVPPDAKIELSLSL